MKPTSIRNSIQTVKTVNLLALTVLPGGKKNYFYRSGWKMYPLLFI